jgi:hypothetical protein
MKSDNLRNVAAGLAWIVPVGLLIWASVRIGSLERELGGLGEIQEANHGEMGRDLKVSHSQLLGALSKLENSGNQRIAEVGRRMQEVERQVSSLASKESDDRGRLDGLGRELASIQQKVSAIETKLGALAGLIDEPITEEPIEFASLTAVESQIKSLGEEPSAARLAEAIAEIDALFPKPEEEAAFQKLKLAQEARLRQIVRAEVQRHQKAARDAPSGEKASEELAEAMRTLVLYPQSDDGEVLREAQQLQALQEGTRAKIQVIRRLRYNRWATEQVEKAINFYNANVSRWNPFGDNTVLIAALVENLGAVDPALLEPAVLELYNHVIERTKDSINEANKLDLAKRLTDPSIRRRGLEDF